MEIMKRSKNVLSWSILKLGALQNVLKCKTYHSWSYLLKQNLGQGSGGIIVYIQYKMYALMTVREVLDFDLWMYTQTLKQNCM